MKVNFAILFLQGMALQFFKLVLLGEAPDEPWTTDWQEFMEELQINFSLHDPVADAEAELDHLTMKGSERISKYNVEFNRISM